VPAGKRRLLELLQISTVMGPDGKGNIATGEAALRQYGRGYGAAGYAVAAPREVIAEDNRPPLEGFGEAPVVVELRAQRLKSCLKLGAVLQFAFRQPVQHPQPGALVGFREDHVEAEQGDAVLVEQLPDELRYAIPSPGPTADFPKRFLVDVENDDAIVHALRHGETHFGVIDDGVKAIDEAELVEPRGMAEQNQQYHEPERVPDDVLLQDRPLLELSRNDQA
jgi:hypothetical protein